MGDALVRVMLEQLKVEWQEFRGAQAGERFAQHHERYQAREAPLLKAMLFFATVFCVGMSVVLPFVPDSAGLALVYVAIAAVLLPGESRGVAAALDKIETLASRRVKPRSAADPPLKPSEAVHEPERPARRPQPSRPTVRMPLPLAGSEVPAVLTAPPTIITDLHRTTPCVRARVVPPRIAGTLKIWGPDRRLQPSAASKPTNLVFPPPADAIAEDTSAIPKRGS